MWKFWQKPLGEPLSAALRCHLILEHHVSEQDAASLHMLRERGRYAGRKVTYFRIFDWISLQAAGIELHRQGDLSDARTLHSGHIDDDGQIVLTLPAEPS